MASCSKPFIFEQEITEATERANRLERIPKSQRYRLSDCGLKTALFYSRLHQRLLRAGLPLAGLPSRRWRGFAVPSATIV